MAQYKTIGLIVSRPTVNSNEFELAKFVSSCGSAYSYDVSKESYFFLGSQCCPFLNGFNFSHPYIATTVPYMLVVS
jgi:hypothetical protein